MHAHLTASASPRHDQPVQEYHLKWVDWNDRKTPIVTQNENGPCPLIAILNVLLLRAVIEIPEGVEIVTATQLFNYLGNTILQRTPEVRLAYSLWISKGSPVHGPWAKCSLGGRNHVAHS